MENDKNIRFGYYIDSDISEGRFMDDQIGVLSGRLDELCLPIADPKQHRHVEIFLINDMKEIAEEDYRRRHSLNSMTKEE